MDSLLRQWLLDKYMLLFTESIPDRQSSRRPSDRHQELRTDPEMISFREDRGACPMTGLMHGPTSFVCVCCNPYGRPTRCHQTLGVGFQIIWQVVCILDETGA